MMSYPPDHSQSGQSYSENFEQLARIRRTLLALLRKEKEVKEYCKPGFSLFCSKKNYREDELHQGLSSDKSYGFSEN